MHARIPCANIMRFSSRLLQEHLAAVIQHACQEHSFLIRTLTCRVRTLVSGEWTVSWTSSLLLVASYAWPQATWVPEA